MSIRPLVFVALFACGDRRTTPTAPPIEPRTTDAAATQPSDASIVAIPDVLVAADALPRSASYRVRLGTPSRVATINRDAKCNERNASCKLGDCFQLAPYVDKPPSKPAMVACERDSDCELVWTGCCKPDSIDIRAARVGQGDAVTKHVCKGTPCGSPYEGLVESFTIACVEKTCRMVDAVLAMWCENRDTRYRVTRLDGKVTVAERTFGCFPPAASCNLAHDCYSEVDHATPRPSAEMRRCKRDSDCTITHVECCNCGATNWRAIRIDAGQKWRAQNCKDPVTCLGCVTPLPQDLAPACLDGSCELLKGERCQ